MKLFIFIRAYLLVVLSCICLQGFSQAKIDSMINLLKKNDFIKVRSVKDSLVSYQEKSIPKLIEVLRDTSYVKLINTTDLIYPGATQFYGHGGILNYDIDWLSVRAAWLVEEITFQDFGYESSTLINEDTLMKLHEKNYSDYLKKGYHNINFSDETPREKLKAYRLILADSVERWWSKNKDTWTRLGALKQALSSNNIHRQDLALEYLRFDQTMCDGLTIKSYEMEIKPLVKKIKHSHNSDAEQAKLLLQDNEYYWLKIKPVKGK